MNWQRHAAGLIVVLTVATASSSSAHYLYVNNNAATNSVSGFAVDPVTGGLTAVPGSPFATGGMGAFLADVDSIAICGDFLYATDGSSGDVSAFVIDDTTGALTGVAGSPFAAGPGPTGLACTPDVTRLFVGNFFDNTIGIFDINSLTGALTPNVNNPFAVPGGSQSPFDLEINASGTRLFVSQDLSNNVGVYDIALSGALSPVAGSPFAAGGLEHGGVLSPNEDFYYVADVFTSISGYSVGVGGALTPLTGSPFAFPASDLAMDDAGARLFASFDQGSNIHVFDVDPLTGVPTPVSGSPFTNDTTSPGCIAFGANFLFVSNGFFDTTASTVSVYTIDPATGTLGSVPGSPFARGVTSAAGGIAFRLITACGNGITEYGEDCDDGNTANGDCCSSTCKFESAGSACTSDSNACTVDTCNSVGVCLHDAQPAGICRTALKSLLLFKQNGGTKDKLVWKWLKGQSTSQTEFADPKTTGEYTLCVYSGTVNALIAAAKVPPSPGKWSLLGTKGYKYLDPSSSAAGIQKIVLKGSGSNRSKALVKGRGMSLPDPVLASIATPVTVQLVKPDTSLCLGSTFASGDVIKQTTRQFKAKAQ